MDLSGLRLCCPLAERERHPIRGKVGGALEFDGNSYVDYVLGMGPCILGHAPPAVTASVAATLSQGQLFAGQHRGEIELARRVTGRLGPGDRLPPEPELD